jgi:hypothetical protein
MDTQVITPIGLGTIMSASATERGRGVIVGLRESHLSGRPSQVEASLCGYSREGLCIMYQEIYDLAVRNVTREGVHASLAAAAVAVGGISKLCGFERGEESSITYTGVVEASPEERLEVLRRQMNLLESQRRAGTGIAE